MNRCFTRQIVLDTETTGMNKFGCHYEGHRIIEIGAVEIINRRLTGNNFHVYLNPHRSVDSEAFKIHGISDQFLIKQPDFMDIVDKFLLFIRDSELIIHNASFDLGFLNNELEHLNNTYNRVIESYCCTITDSLKIARKMFPGQRNSLDALCERYDINKDKRVLHNALIDSELLAYVFLLMTGGQTEIKFKNGMNANESYTKTENMVFANQIEYMSMNEKKLKIIYADESEYLDHNKYLDLMEKSNKNCLWKKINKKSVK